MPVYVPKVIDVNPRTGIVLRDINDVLDAEYTQEEEEQVEQSKAVALDMLVRIGGTGHGFVPGMFSPEAQAVRYLRERGYLEINGSPTEYYADGRVMGRRVEATLTKEGRRMYRKAKTVLQNLFE